MTILPLPLSVFVSNLERGRNFSVSRYGDGEWFALTGAEGQNCDGVRYTPDLAAALSRSLTEHADYIHCMGPKASSNPDLAPRVETWLTAHAPHVVWHNSESLLDASLKGHLFPFVHALTQRKVMLVGGAHLRKLPVLKPVVHIQVPARDAFSHLERMEGEVLKRAARADVILLAAGPAAKVMLHTLHKTLGKTHTLLDVGSLFDLYAGVDSRRYARKMEPAQKQWLLERNFYG